MPLTELCNVLYKSTNGGEPVERLFDIMSNMDKRTVKYMMEFDKKYGYFDVPSGFFDETVSLRAHDALSDLNTRIQNLEKFVMSKCGVITTSFMGTSGWFIGYETDTMEFILYDNELFTYESHILMDVSTSTLHNWSRMFPELITGYPELFI